MTNPTRWRTHDGRDITVRDMTDLHLANAIDRLEIAAEREKYKDATLGDMPVREIALTIYPTYLSLITERARRIEAERVNAGIAGYVRQTQKSADPPEGETARDTKQQGNRS